MNLRMGHPLWLHGGGLGHAGYKVLQALDPTDGSTRQELVHATGLGPGAVSRALRALADIGATTKATDNRWYPRLAFDADLAARRLGLHARMVARDARIDAEAALHRQAVAVARQRHQDAIAGTDWPRAAGG